MEVNKIENPFNPKFEIAKSKILFSSDNIEEKQKAIQTFLNIFKNPEIELRYRMESLGFLIGTQFDENSAYNELINILLNEPIEELKLLTVIRKIKELRKEEEFKKWILQNLLNNNSLKSNQRYLIIKSSMEILDMENEILSSINHEDFFNVIFILKDNPNYKEKVFQILIEKVFSSDPMEKLIYLNTLYTLGYKIEEILEKLVSQDEDHYFLIILLSQYYQDIKMFNKINNMISNKFSYFTNIFFNHFTYSLKNQVPTISYIPIEFNNIFHKLLYIILTKDNNLINSLKEEVIQKYKGLYIAIINRYLKVIGLETVDSSSDLSEIEIEYLSLEDAIIEINISKSSKDDKPSTKSLKETITEQKIQDTQSEAQKPQIEEIEIINKTEKNSTTENYIEEVIEDIKQDLEEILKNEEIPNNQNNLSSKIDIKELEENIEKYILEIQQVELIFIKNLLKNLFQEDKEKFYELIEKYIFDDRYLESYTDKVLEIIKIYQEIDETNANITIKNVISVFFNNESFDKLTKIMNSFNILQNKLSFHNYIAKNELIEWGEKTENTLLSYIEYIRDSIPPDITGKFCMLIIDSDSFSRKMKKEVEKIIENLFG
ncbi:MAG: hypothetical protein RMJ36_05250 [Candidatus Calescibacterium sp.]|nr:hypothetical protein [Candidatus Calescibacterium sp.]MDW8133041.1 hypothetical protein [Candidatus Calescibacterium sp.]